jgi:hypothetical protein
LAKDQIEREKEKKKGTKQPYHPDTGIGRAAELARKIASRSRRFQQNNRSPINTLTNTAPTETTVIERKTGMEFPTSYSGCPFKECGYLSVRIVWPFYVTAASLCEYECTATALDAASFSLGLNVAEKNKNEIIDILNERLTATNRQGKFIIASKDHRDHLKIVVDQITCAKMQSNDRFSFIYSSGILTFNIKTALHGEYSATINSFTKEAFHQVRETFAQWYYKD